jgi:hypothetical protein
MKTKFRIKKDKKGLYHVQQRAWFFFWIDYQIETYVAGGIAILPNYLNAVYASKADAQDTLNYLVQDQP